MKIFHVSKNYANTASTAVKILNKNNISSYGLVEHNKFSDSKPLLSVPKIVGKNILIIPILILQRILLFSLSLLKNPSVIHWHSQGFIPFKIDNKLTKLFKIPVIVQFHGTETRYPEREFLDNVYFKDSFFRYNFPQNKIVINYSRSRKIQKRLSSPGTIFVGAPEMHQYINKELFPERKIIFLPVILDEFEPSYPDPNKQAPLIVHSSSRPVVKGTDYVLKAVEILKNRGYIFEFKLVTNMKREKAMHFVKKADIFIDSLIYGNYGMASIEAMAFGKPVFCYIKETIDYPVDLPIVKANMDNLPQKLAVLIRDGLKRHELGKKSRRYVEKYHSEEAYLNTIVPIYKRAVNRNNR